MSAPEPPDVSLVIPAYNRADLLERCLASLRAAEGVTWEAIVVDNASPEDLSPVRTAFPEVRWITATKNIGYAAANNLGARGAKGRYLAYLNSDAELPPEALRALVDYLDAHSDVGAVTPCNVGLDGRPQPSLSPEHGLAMAWLRDSGLHLLFPSAPPFRGWTLPGFDYSRTQEVATTQTTCLLLRRGEHDGRSDIWPPGDETVRMDPELFLFYNDVDLCRRLRRGGRKLVYLAEARVIHHGSASVETAGWKERQLWRDRYRYFRKWYGFRGTAGVRFACFTRGVTRVASHLFSGRWGSVPEVWRTSAELLLALNDPRNGA